MDNEEKLICGMKAPVENPICCFCCFIPGMYCSLTCGNLFLAVIGSGYYFTIPKENKNNNTVEFCWIKRT